MTYVAHWIAALPSQACHVTSEQSNPITSGNRVQALASTCMTCMSLQPRHKSVSPTNMSSWLTLIVQASQVLLIRPQKMLINLGQMRKRAFRMSRKPLTKLQAKHQSSGLMHLLKCRVPLQKLLTLRPSLQTLSRVSCSHVVQHQLGVPMHTWNCIIATFQVCGVSCLQHKTCYFSSALPASHQLSSLHFRSCSSTGWPVSL